MTTINISLPDRLKQEADLLVKSGLYISFSDLIRDCLRQAIANNRYDLMVDEAKRDLKEGKAKILTNKKDIDTYLETV